MVRRRAASADEDAILLRREDPVAQCVVPDARHPLPVHRFDVELARPFVLPEIEQRGVVDFQLALRHLPIDDVVGHPRLPRDRSQAALAPTV